MVIRRLYQKCLLRPVDLRASRDDLEVVGVLNPGAIAVGDQVVLLVRVAERPWARREGFTALPRWDAEAGLAIDWMKNDQLDLLDPRVVRRKCDGLVRLTFISHLRVIRSAEGRSIDSEQATTFGPANTYEEFGVEDPRITQIGETFYFTYVAVSRHGAATALASTKDFQTFQRHGVIFCPENKDVVLFDEKIDGSYLAIHRPNAATPFAMPEMWLARSRDLIDWGSHQFLLGGSSKWNIGRVGAGVPPIRTPRGWLAIYHGNSKSLDDPGVGIYSAAAVLLDLDNPQKVIAHSAGPIMVPEADFERQGFVSNIVFPTGVVRRDDTLQVYYGAADAFTGVVEFSLDETLGAMQ